METAPINPGDSCIVNRHAATEDVARVARVMAVAEGYAMVRYPRAVPFVVALKELSKIR